MEEKRYYHSRAFYIVPKDEYNDDNTIICVDGKKYCYYEIYDADGNHIDTYDSIRLSMSGYAFLDMTDFRSHKNVVRLHGRDICYDSWLHILGDNVKEESKDEENGVACA